MKKALLLTVSLAANLYAATLWGQTTNSAFQFNFGAVSPLNVSLPAGADIPNSNISFGSSGFGRLGNHFLIGGSGFGTAQRSAHTAFGQVSSDFGMGFADIGYAFAERGRNLHYCFAGIGGGGIDIRYNNTGEQDITLADNLSLKPNERAHISSGGFAWQAGFSFNRLLFNPETKNGGLKIGLDLGVFHFPYLSRWRNEVSEQRLQSIGRPQLQGFFARLTVGGAW